MTTAVTGFTPSQIAQAYGLSKISFSNSTAAANGAGQTIAIVDAFNDPKIEADLGVFDSQFGVPAPPSFKVVNQTGGKALPSSTGADAAGWASTISLDVEWAHALAPGANILLVEARSDTVSKATGAPVDLLAAAKYAAGTPGVSVVSIDWGGSEFSDETSYDSIFTTPAGHQGVTFVASAGGTGSTGDVNWPATSPNVLSVGSTSLTTSDVSGTYSTESSWSGSTGGYSQIEPEPAFQDAVQSKGTRSTPDVSIDGDANTGIAIYDSVPDTASGQTSIGWLEFGTSGAPLWAALIADADQGRALAGKAALDGATQTLPTLYGLYGAPGTSGYSTYTSYFNDVIDSAATEPTRFGTSNPATAGYDTATGLGTPQAAALVDALIASTTTTPAPTPTTPSLTPTVVATLPPALVAGQKSKATVTVDVTNEGVAIYNGLAMVQLFASTDGTLNSGDTPIGKLPKPLKIKPGQSKAFKFTLSGIPSAIAPGNYFIVAEATDAAGVSHTASSATAVAIAQPFVDLAADTATAPTRATPSRRATASVLVTNGGNVPASGSLPIALLARPAGTTGAEDVPLATVADKINLKPARGTSLKLRFILPASLPAATYMLVVKLNPDGTFAESNTADDTAVSARTFTIA